MDMLEMMEEKQKPMLRLEESDYINGLKTGDIVTLQVKAKLVSDSIDPKCQRFEIGGVTRKGNNEFSNAQSRGKTAWKK